eukprot:c53841_g1_i1.p2 GENE.c53841_g1_i1~~c53841_g1_i1.p2  ORF type:complete len:101 (-),score=17.35 c53841_g1_i1:64-366(-)
MLANLSEGSVSENSANSKENVAAANTVVGTVDLVAFASAMARAIGSEAIFIPTPKHRQTPQAQCSLGLPVQLCSPFPSSENAESAIGCVASVDEERGYEW